MTTTGRFGISGERWRVLLLCGLAVFLAGYDGSILFVVLPGVAHDLSADVAALSRLGSVLSLGAALAIPLARVADRGSRGRVVALGVAGFSAAGLMAGLAGSLALLAVARFFAVGFEALVGAAATAIVIENVARQHRARAVSLLSLAGGGGFGVVVIAYPVVAPHWRYLYLAGAALAPAALLMLWLPDACARVPGADALATLRRRPWLRRVVLLSVSGVLGALLYEPAGLFGVYFGSHTLAMSPTALSAVIVVSGFLAVAGYLAGGLVSDRLGRRVPGVVLSCLTAAITGLTFSGALSMYLAGNFIGSLVASAAAPMLGAWTAELFPTGARATAFTVTGFAGAVGAIAALQLHGLVAPRLGQGMAIWLMVPAALLGVLLLLLMPETAGDSLDGAPG